VQLTKLAWLTLIVYRILLKAAISGNIRSAVFYRKIKVQSGCRRFRDRTNGTITISDVTCSGSASAAGGGVRQRKVYIKKPLNAFMLFMKEMRQKVIDECTLKESAAINQILGRKVIILTTRSSRTRIFQ